MNNPQIALIGNPNCGKTTLFNALTGARQRVGNWPGVTVDKKTGYYHYSDKHHHSNKYNKNKRVDVTDLPGTYAIESMESGVSQDELVVRNYVLADSESLLVNIVDATNLQRNLYLTTQLLDLNRPMIVVLNMMDSLDYNGEQIDVERLQLKLGCPVVAISANRKQGINTLLTVINDAIQNWQTPQPQMMTLGEQQEAIVQQYIQALPADSLLHSLSRWQLFELLLGAADSNMLTPVERQQLFECREQLAEGYGGELDIALASARYDSIDALSRLVVSRPRQASKTLTEKIDSWALGRILGIPLFLAAMYLMFMLAINLGSAFIDFFDILFGTLLVEGTTHLLNAINSPDWLVAILANGVGGGIQTVSTFIPVIAAMFLCLSFLEDSGYLARAAMVVDRGMRGIGLPGKAFVPMLVGFGCNVPAIMGTRTLESPRDRLMSIMMIPYMSCGARLPVYALFAAVFFPENGQNIVFILYLVGIAVAVFTGMVLKHTILPGKTTPFIMELPAYRLPTLRNLLMLTWERLKGFILQAGKAIVLMVVVLSIFNSLGTDGSFGNENTDKSVLAKIGKQITPVFSPMGIEQENWPATVGIFTGIFAKEAVIGTLNALYSQMGQEADGDEPETFDLLAGVQRAFASIPENLAGLTDSLGDPLGISNNMAGGDLAAIQQENDVNDNTVQQLSLAFTTTAAAVAYLIFILLYTPCAAALGAVYREAGIKWTITVAVWTFVLAWIGATAYYQISRLSSAPTEAMLWLGGMSSVLLTVFLILRWLGRSVNPLILLPEPKECPEKSCH